MKYAIQQDVAQCNMVLYYGNKSGSALTDVRLTITNADAFAIQQRPDAPFSVAPKEQGQQLVQWKLMRPFGDPPTATLTFSCGSRVELKLTLPLLLTHFVQPKIVEAAVFLRAWNAVGNEVRVTRQQKTAVSTQQLEAALVAMNFALIAGADPNADNLCVAGTLHTATKGPDGVPVTMPIVMRLETKRGANMFRMTVRSGHMGVSNGVVAALSRITQSSG
jgi:hypothetical protein